MLIFDENTTPIIIDNIYTPILTESFWVLDLGIRDFKLTPLTILEEIVAPTMELMVYGFRFCLPASWNLLIVDDDTSALDIIQVSELAGKEFRAFLYGPTRSRAENTVVSVVNYYPSYPNVGPSLNKQHMLCHPVGPGTWINVSPADTYNKYLKNAVSGDLI